MLKQLLTYIKQRDSPNIYFKDFIMTIIINVI